MENTSEYTSSESEEDDHFYDATENVQNKDSVQHKRFDDIFGKEQPKNRSEGEEEKTTGVEIGTNKQKKTEQSEIKKTEQLVESEIKIDSSVTPTHREGGDASSISSEADVSKDLAQTKLENSDTYIKNEGSCVDDMNRNLQNDEKVDNSERDETNIQNEITARMEMEDKLSDEEKLDRKEDAQNNKLKGNELFKSEEYLEAGNMYTAALDVCPLTFKKERSIMFSNRAACKLRLEQLEEAIGDCSEALILNPLYMKALLRRAKTYELLEKLDEAFADYQKALELDAGCHEARSACMRLPDLIKERNEKLKAEMMSKLKDLGNMVLRPFGLSTNNFQFNQDPNTGSYSVNFQNAGGGNGK